MLFSKQLLKNIGIDGDEKLNVHLNIEPDITSSVPEVKEMPEIWGLEDAQSVYF